MWVGYAPAESGDSAGLVVVAPPLVPGGKFFVLEKHQFRGMDFNTQAETIRQITKRYNVAYIGIDTTGMGSAVQHTHHGDLLMGNFDQAGTSPAPAGGLMANPSARARHQVLKTLIN